MRVAIVGIGAMGCLFAGRLSSLVDVIMAGNWQEQIATLNTHGLRLIHPDGRETHHRVKATDNQDVIGRADLALVVVKSPKTASAADVARQALGENGLALTLQNGLGNLEILAAVVGQERAALGVTSEGATLLAPGLVRHAGAGLTHLATTSATAGRLEEVAALFRAAGFVTHLVEDADSLVWGKLAVNAGINPITALLQLPNGFLAENEAARKVMEEAAEETAAVARAQGITLPYASAGRRALEVAQATAANLSSMAQDMARGEPTEIEAICGAVVRLGRRYGVPTPANELLLRLIQAKTASLTP
ncbi:MAG: 2-dehydropantoate 2-reductase [Chloroflexi bacterium]|nr:2-dehydropantoate 2-reductase [Chloroflexota bacterium]MCI0648483.1 2-dehydropantoate 2-reductase [Chloroflexota bacterium]MCI0726007.1 2-dehydropantoate 2-reductase [Chloroflexota bacterium]